MNGFFIAGYVLFGVMSILGLIYLYTLFIYSKYTIFTKTKYNWAVFGIYGLMFVILLVMGILFLTVLKNSLPDENNYLHAGLCFGFLLIDVVCLVSYALIVHFHNKNKIPYVDIPKTDFKPKLEQIKAKIGDIEAFKAKLQKHHKNYYRSMLLAYQELLKKLHENNFSQAEKIADIVLFNDTYAHKWCGFTNNYQLLLTYEFLTII